MAGSQLEYLLIDVWVIFSLTVRNKVPMSFCVQVLCVNVFISLGYNG